MTSENNGSFYYLHCLHSFGTKNKLELHKNACEKKQEFCNVTMPSEDLKISEFHQH